MTDAPSYVDLADKAGISRSYAHEILGERVPPLKLAVHIFKTTGWRHKVIESLTDAQIDAIASVDPWKPKAPAEQSEQQVAA